MLDINPVLTNHGTKTHEGVEVNFHALTSILDSDNILTSSE
jgi:hypothetical protein